MMLAQKARVAGAMTPTSDQADGANVGQVGEQSKRVRSDFRCFRVARQTPLTIEGEDYARAYLDRLQRGSVSPDDLAVLVAFLRGEMLAGFCRLIEKALGVHHA